MLIFRLDSLGFRYLITNHICGRSAGGVGSTHNSRPCHILVHRNRLLIRHHHKDSLNNNEPSNLPMVSFNDELNRARKIL
jgi:hypothetical protein